MVKIQIKSEKLTSFGGIFPIMEKFDRMLSHTIDSTLGLRSKVYGYQYSEIIRSLMCVWRVMCRRRVLTPFGETCGRKSLIQNRKILLGIAIAIWTKYLCAELAMKFCEGIRVNTIAPGFLLTNQNRTFPGAG